MDIITQLLLLSLVFAVGYTILVMQAVSLGRTFYRISGRYSGAWTLFAVAFIITGGLRIWSMIRLPIAILKAKSQGVLPESLTLEQWITVGIALSVMVILIIAFDRHRRDLMKLGL